MTDYSERVKALRVCGSIRYGIRCISCPYNGNGCHEKLCTDAADAIEALQAQLPKRGEWQKAKPKGVVTYSDGYAECSRCHETIWLGWGMNFCPHCGTQNRIIDPDDYDGAKMNDSNASNALNALDNAQDGPIVTPCRGCSDYDGYGGCKSKGGCARARMEVQK